MKVSTNFSGEMLPAPWWRLLVQRWHAYLWQTLTAQPDK